ncbi:MAG: type II secretion system protein GspG [bacterium]
MLKKILPFFLVFVMGCEQGGGFRDIALVRQAKREIRRIRNAIEEYKLDHSYYPSENSDLKTLLSPYLCKFIYSEGKDVAEYTSVVLSSRSNLDQLISGLSGCARIKDAEIEAIYDKIQSAFKLYEQLLAGEDVKPPSISQDISKLQELISKMKPNERKNSLGDSLIKATSLVVSVVDKSIQGISKEEDMHLKNIRSTFEYYNSELSGKKVSEKPELFDPGNELKALKEINPDSSAFQSVKDALAYYNGIKGLESYYDFLTTLVKDIERSKKIFAMFEAKVSGDLKAAKIVQAQAVLRRMADALRDYKRKEGTFPSQDVNIESVLHPYFVETTVSGERIDRWESSVAWLTAIPTYKTTDPSSEFVLLAQVNNEAKTPVSIKLTVQNEWDNIVSAFAVPLTYTTPDSSQTYFIKTRAKDTGNSFITDRPPVIKKGA